jgi:hypothetical protein
MGGQRGSALKCRGYVVITMALQRVAHQARAVNPATAIRIIPHALGTVAQSIDAIRERFAAPAAAPVQAVAQAPAAPAPASATFQPQSFFQLPGLKLKTKENAMNHLRRELAEPAAPAARPTEVPVPHRSLPAVRKNSKPGVFTGVQKRSIHISTRGRISYENYINILRQHGISNPEDMSPANRQAAIQSFINITNGDIAEAESKATIAASEASKAAATAMKNPTKAKVLASNKAKKMANNASEDVVQLRADQAKLIKQLRNDEAKIVKLQEDATAAEVTAIRLKDAAEAAEIRSQDEFDTATNNSKYPRKSKMHRHRHRLDANNASERAEKAKETADRAFEEAASAIRGFSRNAFAPLRRKLRAASEAIAHTYVYHQPTMTIGNINGVRINVSASLITRIASDMSTLETLMRTIIGPAAHSIILEGLPRLPKHPLQSYSNYNDDHIIRVEQACKMLIQCMSKPLFNIDNENHKILVAAIIEVFRSPYQRRDIPSNVNLYLNKVANHLDKNKNDTYLDALNATEPTTGSDSSFIMTDETKKGLIDTAMQGFQFVINNLNVLVQEESKLGTDNIGLTQTVLNNVIQIGQQYFPGQLIISNPQIQAGGVYTDKIQLKESIIKMLNKSASIIQKELDTNEEFNKSRLDTIASYNLNDLMIVNCIVYLLADMNDTYNTYSIDELFNTIQRHNKNKIVDNKLSNKTAINLSKISLGGRRTNKRHHAHNTKKKHPKKKHHTRRHK